MDASSLGDVSALDDAAIVAKCQHLPVAKIAVVRVFPGAAADTAVVTVYDKKAAVVSSFSGEAGKAIVADAGAGSGVSVGAAAAVGTLAAGAEKSRAEAQDQYDKTYVWFEDWVAMQVGSGRVVADWSVPYQGKYKKSLEGAEFYEVVGREDLASSYRTRSAWRTGLILGGYGALIGGATYAIYGITAGVGECSFSDPNYDACEAKSEDDAMSALTLGGIIAGGGLVLGLVGGFINPHPIEVTEAKQLADEHNQKLKRDLGLSSSDRGIDVDAGLVATNGGAGLQLSGTFW